MAEHIQYHTIWKKLTIAQRLNRAVGLLAHLSRRHHGELAQASW